MLNLALNLSLRISDFFIPATIGRQAMGSRKVICRYGFLLLESDLLLEIYEIKECVNHVTDVIDPYCVH